MNGTLDRPPCTCITKPVGRHFRALVVLDPFCHIPQHKEAAAFGAEPDYK